MHLMVNGRVVEVPTASDGSIDSDDLRDVGGVPDDRPLILQRADGSNELINPSEKMRVNPGEHFMDAPIHTRGGCG